MKHQPTKKLKDLLAKVTTENLHPSIDFGLDEMIGSFDPARHGGEIMVTKPVGREKTFRIKKL